jgi:hypothetical protein
MGLKVIKTECNHYNRSQEDYETADAGGGGFFEGYAKTTRWTMFLAEMERVVP